MNAIEASKPRVVGADPARFRGRPLSQSHGPSDTIPTLRSHRGKGDGMLARRSQATRETPGGGRVSQPDAREGQAGPTGESERFIVPWKPAKVGGGKGPQFQDDGRRSDSREIGDEPNTSTEGWEATGDVAR